MARYDDLQIAREVGRMGIHEGDRLAFVGESDRSWPFRLWGWTHNFTFVGGYRMVAMVPDDQVAAFWKMEGGSQSALFDRLAAHRIKAILTKNYPARPQAPLWQPVPNTPYFIHLLPDGGPPTTGVERRVLSHRGAPPGMNTIRLHSGQLCMYKSLLLSFLGSGLLLEAQEPRPHLIDFNRHAWVSYAGDHPVAGRWGIHFDAQWRRAELGTAWQQYQLRTGVNFQASRNVLLTLGYAFTRAYPYGEFPPVAAAFPEHRIYQQALVRHRFRTLRLSHRIRMEQRFVRYPQNTDGSWTYQNRFRYMLKADFPVTERGGGIGWYVPAFNEILIGLPPNYGYRPFDQNRVFLGVGRGFGAVGNLEAGYMNQFLGQRNGRVFEFNSTLLVTFTSSMPLGKVFGR
jgi:hypothetical protein